MKAVKDKDALQKIVDSWFASSKNLWKLIDCGMSSTVKLGLGHSIKSNAEVLGYEEEMSRAVQTGRIQGVPPPLSGDYTPRAQEDIDDSLYVYGKHGPQPQSPSPTVSNASSIVFSICPSNDSDGELGVVSDASSTHYSTCQSNDMDGCELGTLTAIQSMMTQSYTSVTELESKNGKRISSAGTQFKSGASRFNTGKQHVNSGRMYVNSGTQNKSGGSRVNTGKQNVNTARVNRPYLSNQTSQVNLKSPKKCFSKQSSPVNRPFSRNTAYKSNIYAVKGKMGTAVKTSAGCVWRKTTPHSNTNSGPTPDSYVHVSQGPQGRPKPVKAWVPKRN
ncbi:hypothetical protein Tco_0286572 [Tanacetum coccineum]